MIHTHRVDTRCIMRIIYNDLRRLSGEKRIALFMGLNDVYEHGITRGVARYAKLCRNWRLYGYGWMFRPLDAVEYWHGDGIIARVESKEDAERLAALEIPVIDVAGAYLHSGFHQVNNDDYATGVRAGEYLLSCGFKRFAYCGVRNVGWSEKRNSGFSERVRETCKCIPVFEESLPWWEHLENSDHLSSWLSGLDYPVGIFACNDTAGLKLTELCRNLGLEVPGAVAILGVDDEDILCEMAFPTLTSISLDCEEIGYRAAALLDDLLQGTQSQIQPADTLFIPPKEIAERESTRIFTCDDSLVEQAVRYIRAHATEGIHVSDVSTFLPSSRRNLEVRFRREIGRTLREEILRVRLDHAKTRLRNTEETVAAVGEESGFGTLQRFHILFKRYEGLTPGRYRNEQRRYQG